MRDAGGRAAPPRNRGRAPPRRTCAGRSRRDRGRAGEWRGRSSPGLRGRPPHPRGQHSRRGGKDEGLTGAETADSGGAGTPTGSPQDTGPHQNVTPLLWGKASERSDTGTETRSTWVTQGPRPARALTPPQLKTAFPRAGDGTPRRHAVTVAWGPLTAAARPDPPPPRSSAPARAPACPPRPAATHEPAH